MLSSLRLNLRLLWCKLAHRRHHSTDYDGNRWGIFATRCGKCHLLVSLDACRCDRCRDNREREPKFAPPKATPDGTKVYRAAVADVPAMKELTSRFLTESVAAMDLNDAMEFTSWLRKFATSLDGYDVPEPSNN